jgi:Protein of unknown function (DUF2628)
MASYFMNPANGYVEKGATEFTGLWALLFGPFFFAIKGMWGHAILALVLWPISVIVYAFIARGLVEKRYRQLGWIDAAEPPRPR